MAWIGSLLGAVTSFIGADASYNQDKAAYDAAQAAATQDAAAQSKLFGSVENTIGSAWGNYAPYMLAESRTGMDPMVRANAMNSYNVQNQRQINDVRNNFGSMLPNLSGTLEDMQRNNLQSGIQLQGGLAAQDQSIRDSAMQNYFGGAMSTVNPLLNIAGQYGQAGAAAQQNATSAMQGMQANNPWTAVGNSLSGVNFGSMFPGRTTGPSQPTATDVYSGMPQTGLPANYSYNPWMGFGGGGFGAGPTGGGYGQPMNYAPFGGGPPGYGSGTYGR